MIRLTKIVLILNFLIFTHSVFPQIAPGYMGKRLILEYSGSTAPALFRQNQNGNDGLFSWNYGHKITANYSLNRKTAIGVSFELYKTGTDYSNVYLEKSTNDAFGYDNYITYRATGTEASPLGYTGIVNIKGISIFKAKYQNGIAPHGKHSILGLKLLFVSTDLSNVKFVGSNNNNYQNETLYYDLPKGGMNTLEWGFFYGVGVNRIISDKIVVSTGFELAFIISALGEWTKDWTNNYDFSNDSYNQNGVRTEEDLFKKISTERVFSSQFFNLKIGIGFLAY